MARLQAEYVWVIGAASPQTGLAEAILSPVLNTAIINQFLDQFSRALSTNVTWIPLPHHSSELNGIKNLWHCLRSLN